MLHYLKLAGGIIVKEKEIGLMKWKFIINTINLLAQIIEMNWRLHRMVMVVI